MASLRVRSPEAKRKRFPVTSNGVGGGLKGPYSHGGLHSKPSDRALDKVKPGESLVEA